MSNYWFYKDEDGDSIGPSPGGHLHHWITEGHLGEETLVSCDGQKFTSWKLVKTKVPDWLPEEESSDDDDPRKADADSAQQDATKPTAKRKSIVTMKDDNGNEYFFDDPDLGGTGETAWDRGELSAADAAPSPHNIESKNDKKNDEKEEEKVRPS